MLMIDVYEPREIKEALKDIAQVWNQGATIGAGDYFLASAFGEPIGIQRKQMFELLGSIAPLSPEKKPLSEELALLKSRCSEAILLWEGTPIVTSSGKLWHPVLKETRHHLAELSNYLLSCQRAGIIVVWSPELALTPYVIRHIYQYYQKTTHEAMGVRVSDIGFSFDMQERKALGIVATLPGVGNVLASALLHERFGSLRNIFTADQKSLQEVEGIGKQKAKAIEEFVTRSFSRKKETGDNPGSQQMLEIG